MRSKKIGAVGVLAAVTSQAAWCAQPTAGTADRAAVSQCVAMHTTGADRMAAARWLFAMMARSPQISDLATVAADRTNELNQGFAKLITRLVVKDCLTEVRPLAAASLEDGFGAIGQALGETAMKELTNGKEVDDAMGAYTKFLVEDEFKPLIDSLPKKGK